MARADFKSIIVGEVFNSQNTSTTKNFTIESGTGAPIDTGYLLVLCRDVSSSNHKLSINGVELGSCLGCVGEPCFGGCVVAERV